MKNFLAISFLVSIISSCAISRTHEKRIPILLADREAPLGWVYLRIYQDSTFEFESRGLFFDKNIYPGRVEISRDTLYFSYEKEIPSVGEIAVFDTKIVTYIDGEYPERVQIKYSVINKE